MLSDEEKKNLLKKLQYCELEYQQDGYLSVGKFEAIKQAIEVIEKQSKEIEELKREKETNHQMIHLAETQILGYAQGYKDGLNKEITATAIVARERANQIIYEGMKHKINMEWVFKIKAKIEEVKDGTYDAKIILESLLEKE